MKFWLVIGLIAGIYVYQFRAFLQREGRRLKRLAGDVYYRLRWGNGSLVWALLAVAVAVLGWASVLGWALTLPRAAETGVSPLQAFECDNLMRTSALVSVPGAVQLIKICYPDEAAEAGWTCVGKFKDGISAVIVRGDGEK